MAGSGTARVIPGVTSAIAAPALAGIPVTHRSLTQGFTVVSGHVPPGDERSTVDWTALARLNTTLVILMGTSHLPELVTALVEGGKPASTPAAVVENAGHRRCAWCGRASVRWPRPRELTASVRPRSW